MFTLSIQSRKTTFFRNDFPGAIELAKTILLNHGLKRLYWASSSRQVIGNAMKSARCASNGSLRVLSRLRSRPRLPRDASRTAEDPASPLSRQISAESTAAGDKTSLLICSAGLPGFARGVDSVSTLIRALGK